MKLSKSTKLRNAKILGRIPLIIGGILVLGTFIFWLVNNSFLTDDKQTSTVKMRGVGETIERQNAGTSYGGAGNIEYRSKLKQQMAQEAETAQKKGDSFIPPPLSGLQDATPKQENVQAKPEIRTQSVTTTKRKAPNSQKRENPYLQAVSAQIATMQAGLNTKSEFVKTVWPDVKSTSEQAVSEVSKEKETKIPKDIQDRLDKLEPGTVIYSQNDLLVNSDAEGTPVIATVVVGPIKGAKFFGSFKRQSESLIIQFNQFFYKDQTIPIKAYAVDPDTASVGVASSVDTHWLERWGGLIAASAAKGWAGAVQESQSTVTETSSGSVLAGHPEYSVTDQAIIASGEVGSKLAEKFDKNFDMPPTVILDPQQAIGILIIEIGSN